MRSGPDRQLPTNEAAAPLDGPCRGQQGAPVLNRSNALWWSGLALATFLLLVDGSDAWANVSTLRSQVGVDYQLYVDAARRWLETGLFFEAHQLAGPYQISAGDILYPPVALVLLVPFTVLPALLWWLVPILAVAWSIRCLRPHRVVWPLLAACAVWPTTPLKVLTGNPVIWAAGALALGVVYAWPSVIVLIKPSLFPFALFGANRRAWWLALGALLVVCIPFGSLWIDWLHSILNSEGGGLAYSSLEIPLLAFPLIAWVARSDPGSAGPATRPTIARYLQRFASLHRRPHSSK
jgi:hypothetical protein